MFLFIPLLLTIAVVTHHQDKHYYFSKQSFFSGRLLPGLRSLGSGAWTIQDRVFINVNNSVGESQEDEA